MESADSVRAFHGAGAPGGPLAPIYHFNATRFSALLPVGGTVVDLFCGSAQTLRRLLVGRPDLRGIGIDLSERMLETATANLADAGVHDRVQLRRGDAAQVETLITEHVDGIVSLSALHHCPTEQDLRSVLASIARVRDRDGSGVWLFDLVRPADESIIGLIPRAHEVSAGAELDAAFKRDWVSSLRAGWTFEEFRESLDVAGLSLESVEANYSQLHWASPVSSTGTAAEWDGPIPDRADVARADALAAAMGFA